LLGELVESISEFLSHSHDIARCARATPHRLTCILSVYFAAM
jgi:hypothetical protein